jgi:hypothetical protein
LLPLEIGCTPETEEGRQKDLFLESAILEPAESTIRDSISVVIDGIRGIEADALEVHIKWFVDDEEISTSQELAAGSALYTNDTITASYTASHPDNQELTQLEDFYGLSE